MGFCNHICIERMSLRERYGTLTNWPCGHTVYSALEMLKLRLCPFEEGFQNEPGPTPNAIVIILNDAS